MLPPAQGRRQKGAKKLGMKSEVKTELICVRVCVCVCVCAYVCGAASMDQGQGPELIDLDIRRAAPTSRDHPSGRFHRHSIPLTARQIF